MSSKLTLVAFCFFLLGFGLVLIAFIQLLVNMRKGTAHRTFSAKGNLWIRSFLFGCGILLVVISQAMFWFNSKLNVYSPLKMGTPLARVTFLQSQSELPRLILERYDEKHKPVVAGEILLEDSLVQIEMEIVKFKNLGQLFGLDELFRFSRLIYLSEDPNTLGETRASTFGSDDNKIPDLLVSMNSTFSIAHFRTVLTDPLILNRVGTMEISYTEMGKLVLTRLNSAVAGN